MSPEEAQREMAKIGSIVNDGEKFIGSLLAPYVPFVDYQRPVRITPVYFPAWLVSAYVKAEVRYDNTKVSEFPASWLVLFAKTERL